MYLISVLKSLELSSASSLKKHKSLEDLQTNGIREEEEEASYSTSQCASGERKLSGKTSRACGVNESFRAAIDRSYDPNKLDNTNAADAGMDALLLVMLLFSVLLLSEILIRAWVLHMEYLHVCNGYKVQG